MNMNDITSTDENATISIDEFYRTDIRIGEILSAEPIEGSDKLLRLMVSFGAGETRQILSGIARYFPDRAALVGKHVAFVYNLKPRMLMGLESQGMILAASGEEGGFALLEAPAVPAGVRVG